MANTSSTQFKDKSQFKDESIDSRELSDTAKQGNDLRNTVGDIVGEQNVQKAAEGVQQLRDRAQQGMQKVKERATKVAGQLQGAASDYVQGANESIRRYPIQSVLIGLGVGLVLGALLSPKRLV